MNSQVVPVKECVWTGIQSTKSVVALTATFCPGYASTLKRRTPFVIASEAASTLGCSALAVTSIIPDAYR